MRRWITSGIIGVAGALLLASPLALAATPKPSTGTGAGSPGQGLEISPPVIELAADPGQTVTTYISVRNVTKGELIAKGKADDFGAGTDESGQPKLLLNETGATRYSLKYWVTGVPDLRLAPGELKKTLVTFTVPRNAEPGGHFGVVRFTAIPPELEGTGVALSASVGALILMKVSGAVTEKVDIAEFGTGTLGAQDVFKKKDFFEYGPVAFLVRLKNNGTVHEKVQGSIAVTDAFGGKVGTLNVNAKGGNVLPDSIRRFQEELKNKNLFGRYTAKLSMGYGASRSTLSATTSFWVIPWKLVLAVMIGLILLLFAFKVGIKRYNRYIIKMARRA